LLTFRVAFPQTHQHPDPANPVGLLRARGKRPHDRRATNQPDKLAPHHLITSK
jgi:hypothetical protein